MLQLRRDGDLALEARRARALGQVLPQDLDDDLAPERAFLGNVNVRHGAARELAVDGIGGAERVLEASANVHWAVTGRATRRDSSAVGQRSAATRELRSYARRTERTRRSYRSGLLTSSPAGPSC